MSVPIASIGNGVVEYLTSANVSSSGALTVCGELSESMKDVIIHPTYKDTVDQRNYTFKVFVGAGGRLPTRGSAQAAGWDLYAAADVEFVNGKAKVPTNIKVSLPYGTYGRIAPRSGLAAKYSIDVGAGVIDSDYRGNIDVILFKHSDDPVILKAGERIAQLIVEHIHVDPIVQVETEGELSTTVRGAGGFGSTGV